MRPAAILWDYDGTLVDSAVKNRAVTIQLLKGFDPDIEQHLPAALQSLQAYRQASLRHAAWQDVFCREFGCTAQQVQIIDRLWRGGQISDALQPPLFTGLRDVLPQLAAIAPMGVCSRNSADHIRATLRRYGVDDCFGAVVGYESVAADRQKPHPDGLLICLEKLGVTGGEGSVIYIGDHAADVQYTRAAAQALTAKGVRTAAVCITVRFGDQVCLTSATGADACAATPQELLELLQRLCK